MSRRDDLKKKIKAAKDELDKAVSAGQGQTLIRGKIRQLEQELRDLDDKD